MTKKSVWLGLDLGNARIGLALSDPELTFAHPEGVIQAGGDYFYAIDQIVDVIKDREVSHIVLGYPLKLDGAEGKSAKKVRRFAQALSRRLEEAGIDSQIELTDERMTTVSAHDLLLQAGMSSRQHRAVVDTQSAVVILQSALDSRKNKAAAQEMISDNLPDNQEDA